MPFAVQYLKTMAKCWSQMVNFGEAVAVQFTKGKTMTMISVGKMPDTEQNNANMKQRHPIPVIVMIQVGTWWGVSMNQEQMEVLLISLRSLWQTDSDQNHCLLNAQLHPTNGLLETGIPTQNQSTAKSCRS